MNEAVDLKEAENYRGEDLKLRGVPFTVLPSAEVLPYAQEFARKLSGKPRLSLITLKDFFSGQAKQNKDLISLFDHGRELDDAVEKWIQQGKYTKLIEVWTKGLNLDWNKLYGVVKPHRISLPTYPFAKERYWAQALLSKLPAEDAQRDDIETIAQLLKDRVISPNDAQNLILRLNGGKLTTDFIVRELYDHRLAVTTAENLIKGIL